MPAAAARKSGAPTPGVRATSIVLALLFGALPLAALLLGLSMRAIERMHPLPQILDVTLLPEPRPEPSPEPKRVTPPEHPELRSRPAAPAAAPAIAAPAPVVTVPAAAIPAPPVTSPADGSGTGTANGSGTGGNGSGGSGAGGVPAAPAFTPASWVFRPGNREIMPYDPPAAWRERVNGRVVLSCNVLRSTRVANCRVVDERPRGYGFGYAAVAASRTFRLNPPARNGIPDETAWVEIPVAFNHKR